MYVGEKNPSVARPPKGFCKNRTQTGGNQDCDRGLEPACFRMIRRRIEAVEARCVRLRYSGRAIECGYPTDSPRHAAKRNRDEAVTADTRPLSDLSDVSPIWRDRKLLQA